MALALNSSPGNGMFALLIATGRAMEIAAAMTSVRTAVRSCGQGRGRQTSHTADAVSKVAQTVSTLSRSVSQVAEAAFQQATTVGSVSDGLRSAAVETHAMAGSVLLAVDNASVGEAAAGAVIRDTRELTEQARELEHTMRSLVQRLAREAA